MRKNKHNKINQKWQPMLKTKPFLKGYKLEEYNKLFPTKVGLIFPQTVINTKNFYLDTTAPLKANYIFKNNLEEKLSLEFYEFARFFGDSHFYKTLNYPYLQKKKLSSNIYAIRLRNYELYAYCCIEGQIKTIKLTKLISSLGLPYYQTLLKYLAVPGMKEKGKFLTIKTNSVWKATNKKLKYSFLKYTKWPMVRFIVGAAMYYTTNLMWQKVLTTNFKKKIFKPKESRFKYYNYRKYRNIRLQKWELRTGRFDKNHALFKMLFLGRIFYEKLFQKSATLINTPDRGRFVFKYEDKKFMKRFFIQSLIKQGKRLRSINWFKDIMVAVKQRLSLSRITHFKAFFFTLMRLKPRYWLRKYKRGRRTEYFPTWIKDQRNKAEAVRLFLKVSKSTAPGAKNVSKSRIIDLIILNTFLKKNDAYDALISYWKTVRKNMHNMNFVPWV